MNRMLLFLMSVSALTLAGCVSAPKIQPSQIDPGTLWHVSASSSATISTSTGALTIDQVWWQRLDDPTLTALLQEAMHNNLSLKIAKSRVQEARASRGIAQSLLLPQVTGTADASRGNLGVLYGNQTLSYGEAGFSAAWEVDLFGHNQAQTAQANALLQSTQASEQGVAVGLLAEVARNYFDYRNESDQLAITQKNLENQKKTYGVIQAQVEGALSSNFDLQRAAAQVSTTESLIPAILSARDATANRLNILLGVPPGTKDAMLQTLTEQKPVDPHMVVAAPADVLAHRPDVRASERQLAAALSARRAAFSDFFPRITLLGFYGLQTSELNVVSPWSVGGNLVQPILNFGRLRSQLKVAGARQDQAFLMYQQTVIEALEDMNNALSAFVHEYDRRQSLSAAAEQNRKAAELARLQFTNGFTGLLDVLVSERSQLDAESALATSDASLRKNLVNVYAAAGGGWDPS